MGVVYRAAAPTACSTARSRSSAPRRQDPDLARRLDAERRTLARLEHDGIARLYDGGVDDDGAPFLVMEIVDGEPITAYADRAGLDSAARVALFVRVCEAVAYAHRHLVVHRDLKPSNVFVTPDGSPKLLDFGVAKLLDDDERRTETRVTLPGAMTPAYAAPEQVRGEAVTTATDVYALGVLLYELLAGQRPYDSSGQTASDIERTVCEHVPPPPSSASADRARALRGDLDTIVAKAMDKEPARRYASAEALADDLRRHLAGEPVAARPASRAYRARLFVRRHRGAVAGAAAVALALVGGIVATTWQARIARAEAAKAEAVQDFMLGMLGAADPDQDGRDVRVADLLDRAAADLDATFQDQPAVRADAHLRLGRTYYDLGLLARGRAATTARTRAARAPRGRRSAHAPRRRPTSAPCSATSPSTRPPIRSTRSRSRRTPPSRPGRPAHGHRVGRDRHAALRHRRLRRVGRGAHRRALAIEEAALAPDHEEILSHRQPRRRAVQRGRDRRGDALLERSRRAPPRRNDLGRARERARQPRRRQYAGPTASTTPRARRPRPSGCSGPRSATTTRARRSGWATWARR